MRTLAELAKEAIEIQDACNPLGLSKGYAKALQELRERLEVDKLPCDTKAMCWHPINILWATKLSDLAGFSGGDFEKWGCAYRDCKKLADIPTN